MMIDIFNKLPLLLPCILFYVVCGSLFLFVWGKFRKDLNDWLVLFLASSQLIFVSWQTILNLEDGTLCKIQGFMTQLFSATYIGCFVAIPLQLLITISIPSKKIQFYSFILELTFIILYASGSSILLLYYDEYHPAGSWCWVTNSLYQLLSFYGPLVIFFITASMLMWFIFRETKKAKSTGNERVYMKVLGKARLFLILFLLLWIWPAINRLTEELEGKPILIVTLFQIGTMNFSGVITFVIFGTNQRIVTFWKDTWKWIVGTRKESEFSDSHEYDEEVQFSRESANDLRPLIEKAHEEDERKEIPIDNDDDDDDNDQ